LIEIYSKEQGIDQSKGAYVDSGTRKQRKDN
jgi:hypothetical protein